MMKFFKKPKFLIFLIVFVNFLGYGIVFPILPLLTEQYGGNPLTSGVLIAAFSLMQVFAMPIMGRLSDRFGRRPLLLISLWGTVVSFTLMGLTHSIFWLLIARIIDGASGGNISIAQAYIADITSTSERAGGMGVIAAGITLGFIIGPIWGGVFSGIGLSAPFIGAALITFVSIILCQFFLKESLSRKEISYEKKRFRLSAVWAKLTDPRMVLLYLIYLILFWAQSGVFSVLSLFGKDVLNVSVDRISYLFALGGVFSAVIQGFAINWATRLIPERRLFIIFSGVSVLGFLVMAIGSRILIYTLGVTLFFIGVAFVSPLSQSFVSERSSVHEQGGNLGLLQSFGSVGRIFGPVTAGFIYESVSPYAPALMGSALMFLIFILAFRLFAENHVTSRA